MLYFLTANVYYLNCLMTDLTPEEWMKIKLGNQESFDHAEEYLYGLMVVLVLY